MIEVELSRIIINEEKKEQVIVLKEKGGHRSFPVVIGITEALAIRMHLNGTVPLRPLTHDLMCAVLTAFGLTLERVVVDKLIEGTFHAKLWLRAKDNGIKIVDARPSDSIALSVRFKSPIYVEEEVLAAAMPQEL